MPCLHLQHALATAIGIGHDTDTVAAIAGALLGARWGASAVPQEWQGLLHGWGHPLDDDQRTSGASTLNALATLTLRGGSPDSAGWPTGAHVDYSGWGLLGTCAPHPHAEGIWIGDAGAIDALPTEIDAVVSLCRIGNQQIPKGATSHVVRLIDTTPEDNPNLDFVIDDAARVTLSLRDQGHRVFLHCVAAQSRTPTVAARIGVLEGAPLETAIREVKSALPKARPQAWLLDAVRRLSETAGSNRT